jgi:hypothetical protein
MEIISLKYFDISDFFCIFAAEILKYKMKTFRDLKPDDVIIWKNFARYVDCNEIINGRHYIQEVICEDAPCVIEVFNIDYDNGGGGEWICFQVYNGITGLHHVVNMPKKDLDKSETDKFKII